MVAVVCWSGSTHLGHPSECHAGVGTKVIRYSSLLLNNQSDQLPSHTQMFFASTAGGSLFEILYNCKEAASIFSLFHRTQIRYYTPRLPFLCYEDVVFRSLPIVIDIHHASST